MSSLHLLLSQSHQEGTAYLISHPYLDKYSRQAEPPALILPPRTQTNIYLLLSVELQQLSGFSKKT